MSATLPQLTPLDLEVWRRFLFLRPSMFDRFDFQTRVGSGQPLPASATDADRRAWAMLTEKRIDAVGFNGDGITVIEVKPRGGASALGQVLVYRDLYREKFRPAQTLSALVVCNYVDEDVRLTALRLNVSFLAVAVN
ncbi:MAG: hypothetical protein E6Q97_17790 [Desulfurellales bacterium]|nr:MAG: hypothetical protein E6Q97_17790 [Desulfurellales bacterium]